MRTEMLKPAITVGLSIVVALSTSSVRGDAPAPHTAVVVGEHAGSVEEFAAQELCRYLECLFHVTARPSTSVRADASIVFLIGTPASHARIGEALRPEAWPLLSEQGYLIRRTQTDGVTTVVLGGGTSKAALWAVYELAERWGVRFLLERDILPPPKQGIDLSIESVVREPTLRTRQWRVMNALACGPESWGIADYKRVIDQLAKMRFNRILIQVWPWQPFVDFEAGGIHRSSATLFFGFKLPMFDGMPGRSLFGQAKEFWNPDLPSDTNYGEFTKAAQRLLRGIIDHAHQRGMRCVLNAQLDEFPAEFAPLVPDFQKVHQLGGQTIVPGANTPIDDPNLTRLALAALRATVNSYPDVDYLQVGVKEHRQWVNRYEEDWKALDARYGVEKAAVLTDLLASARRRKDYPGGPERAVQEVKGDIVLLRYYDRLFNELYGLQGTQRPQIPLIYNAFAEELGTVIPRVAPQGSEALEFVDYTPSRILNRKEVLERLGRTSLPRTLIFTLHDDNVGLLPQLATGSLHALVGELRRCRWAGFSTRYWLISDHDACVAYLSRAAWDPAVTPDSIYRDQVRAVCGDESVEAMLTLFRELEAATLELEAHAMGLTFPVPGMFTSQSYPGELQLHLVLVRQHYEDALKAARRALELSAPGGLAYVEYWVGRLEFGAGYLNTIEASRRSRRLEQKGDMASAAREAEKAFEVGRKAIESYARVARNQSDRGAIAILGNYVYLPLRTEVARLRKREAQ